MIGRICILKGTKRCRSTSEDKEEWRTRCAKRCGGERGRGFGHGVLWDGLGLFCLVEVLWCFFG